MKRTSTKRRTHLSPTMEADHSGARTRFAHVVRALSHHLDVTVGEGMGFGSGTLKVNGKIFAMVSSRGEFVVKLPKLRADELLASGKGKRFEPMPGRLMKEWVVLSKDSHDWVELAKEAREFVKRGRL